MLGRRPPPTHFPHPLPCRAAADALRNQKKDVFSRFNTFVEDMAQSMNSAMAGSAAGGIRATVRAERGRAGVGRGALRGGALCASKLDANLRAEWGDAPAWVATMILAEGWAQV